MTFLMILFIPVLITGYIALSVKIGFMVGDATINTGFDTGFYLMTVFGMLALPVAIYLEFFA